MTTYKTRKECPDLEKTIWDAVGTDSGYFVSIHRLSIDDVIQLKSLCEQRINEHTTDVLHQHREYYKELTKVYEPSGWENIREVAVRDLGNGDRWQEIYDLNSLLFPEVNKNDCYPEGSRIFIPSK